MNIFVSVFPLACGNCVWVSGLGANMKNITANPEIECKFSNTWKPVETAQSEDQVKQIDLQRS